MKKIEIWSDGACSPNPGKGGWAAILKYGSHERVIIGKDDFTTNNRMELLAAISALEALTEPCSVIVYTDSQYTAYGSQFWIHGWRKKKFKGVVNVDMWKRMDDMLKKHDAEFRWVRGHNGNPMNERVDRLAVEARLA